MEDIEAQELPEEGSRSVSEANEMHLPPIVNNMSELPPYEPSIAFQNNE